MPERVCSQMINITLEGDTVEEVQFIGGCMGNTQGVARLAEGMTVDEVIEKLDGIQCGRRGTSCPDQLATALKQIKAQQ
jgi:uncharacterized protein (TIGR03905 family)